MKDYLPAERLAQMLVICLGIEAFVSTGAMVSSLLQAQLLSRAMAGIEISEAEATFNDLRESSLGVLSVILAIVSGILFLKFAGRTNHNARAMGANDLSATPGWTIGYFFVPVVNLWRPYQILQEIWKASAPEVGSWQSRPGSALLGWWWAVRIIDLIANQIVFRLSLRQISQPSLDSLITSTWLTFGTEGLDVALAVVSIFVVRGLQERQVERHETVGEAAAVHCPGCGENLGYELIFETTCPVCGRKVLPGAGEAIDAMSRHLSALVE